MIRKIAYWSSTALVAASLLMALTYLTGSEQVVSGFTRSGYPQHLRIVLGIAKPLAAIVLLLPGLALVKEWAYAGFAIDLASGKTLWTTQGREGDNASLMTAGPLLLASTTNAELIVARINPARFEEVKRYTIAESAVWAHPAIAGDAIVVKDVDKLICWTVRPPAATEAGRFSTGESAR